MTRDRLHFLFLNVGETFLFPTPILTTCPTVCLVGANYPEFRLTSAVQPQRVHQILYGDSLESYIAGDLIGKSLLDKSTTPAQLVVTDSPAALVLRLRVELPVALVVPADGEALNCLPVQDRIFCSPHAPRDVAAIRSILEKLGPLDLTEPFARIREALGEARKLGVAKAAA